MAMPGRKASALPPLSDTQLEIMHLVWEGGEVTVTDVWSALTRRRRVARNTVLTLMERLQRKGWLVRRVDGQTHQYRAAVPRASTLGNVVGRLVDAAFAGSAEALVLALLQGRGVSDEEARRIRRLIDNARAEKGKS
jgi:predicted transcriptional regulator